MRTLNQLSPRKVATLKKLGRHADGGGLYLQVSQVAKRTTKAWVFRYMIDGKARHMGLGSIDTFNLAEARERARRARQQIKDGIDPINARNDERTARKLDLLSRKTFKQCAEQYIAAYESSWRNERHRDQWRISLEKYAYPVIGDLPVSEVTDPHVLQILEPIWNEKKETARRLRGRIESVLDWADARKYRTGKNPARWKGHLQRLLPGKARIEQKHHSAMPYAEVPAFMAQLRKTDGVNARALEFAILTATRQGEAIKARWEEIDFANKAWTIPADRMKAGKTYRVPLSDRAIQLLKDAPRLDGGFIFPSIRPGKHLSHGQLLKLTQKMTGDGYTAHGFRSCFDDWAHERTAFPKVVIDMALAHAIGDKVEAAYRRGDLFDKRRELMNAWAGYCASTPAQSDVVVPINQARA